MTAGFEDFKQYLPKYLSAEAQTNLFAELDQFPNNIDQRFYTAKLQHEENIFQGDGLAELWISDLPHERIGKARVMVLSNSCDTSRNTKQLVGPRLVDRPIISMPKFLVMLRENPNVQSDFNLSSYLDSVRKQRISSMFYLPKIGNVGEEAIALLDRINNCDAQAVDYEQIIRTRLFTLSDYGFYLFLFKLSIHLTRIREQVARN